MAKKAPNTIAFNMRLSLGTAVTGEGGGTNFYDVGWGVTLNDHTPEQVAEKLTALGVADSDIKNATKAMTAAAGGRTSDMQLTQFPPRKDVALGRGFGVYTVNCASCGRTWIAVAVVGSTGKECPQCGFHDKAFEWPSAGRDLPHDGVWLTGALV